MTDFRILYHYAPYDRRTSIRALGLILPGDPNSGTVSSGTGCVQDGRPVICTGTDPETAWALSGGLNWPELPLTWDLWQVYVAPDAEVYEREVWGRIAEIRLFAPVWFDHIAHVGTRVR